MTETCCNITLIKGVNEHLILLMCCGRICTSRTGKGCCPNSKLMKSTERVASVGKCFAFCSMEGSTTNRRACKGSPRKSSLKQRKSRRKALQARHVNIELAFQSSTIQQQFVLRPLVSLEGWSDLGVDHCCF